MIRSLVLSASLVAFPALAQDPVAPFIDEASLNPEFEAWRAVLIAAVAARDTEAVAAMAGPEIKLSFGGDWGRETFVDWLDGRPPYDHEEYGEAYWQVLETALALGGRFEEKDVFSAPYTYSADYPEDWDPFQVHFVLGADRPVFAVPSLTAEPIERLSEAVVEVPYDAEPGVTTGEDGKTIFLPILRADGSGGFMLSSDLRSLIDYRAIFERSDGVWMMTYFIAGD